MRIRYDREADAVYVEVDEAALRSGKQHHAVEVEPVMLYVDVDADNRVLGIEFLSIDRFERYMRDHDGLFPDDVLSSVT